MPAPRSWGHPRRRPMRAPEPPRRWTRRAQQNRVPGAQNRVPGTRRTANTGPAMSKGRRVSTHHRASTGQGANTRRKAGTRQRPSTGQRANPGRRPSTGQPADTRRKAGTRQRPSTGQRANPGRRPNRSGNPRSEPPRGTARSGRRRAWSGPARKTGWPSRRARPSPRPIRLLPAGIRLGRLCPTGTRPARLPPISPHPISPHPIVPPKAAAPLISPLLRRPARPGLSCPGYPVLLIRELPTRPGPTSGSRAGCTRSRCCGPGGGPARRRPVSRASARDGRPRRRVMAPARPVQDKLRHPASHGRISRTPAVRRRANPRHASRDQKRARASSGRGPTTRRR
jgi:hypothetical protein